jgi:hypothetical protein
VEQRNLGAAPRVVPGVSPRRSVLVPLALVVLLATVALAAAARRPLVGGAAGGRDVSPAFWDYVLSTLLALWLLLVPLSIYAIWARGGWRRDPNTGRRRDVAVLVFLAFLTVLVLAGGGLRQLGRDGERQSQPLPTAPVDSRQGAHRDRPGGELRLAPFVVVGLAFGLGVAVLALRARRRRRPLREGDEHALTAELGLLLDDTLDDLRAEPDPRRAVIAAYARMERAFGAFGLPREEAEAPLEYLGRIAPEVEHVSGATRLAFELTHLYERARFSAHRIDAGMKQDAIRALELLRAELREWAA